jgi:hypothetical protein
MSSVASISSKSHTDYRLVPSSSKPSIDMNPNSKTILLYSNNYLMAFSQQLSPELERPGGQSLNIKQKFSYPIESKVS